MEELKWSGPGGWIVLRRVAGVHYIEEKDCTARFTTGAIWEILEVWTAACYLVKRRETKGGLVAESTSLEFLEPLTLGAPRVHRSLNYS